MILKAFFLDFYTFGVRRTLDVLDLEIQPGSGNIRTGSGALGLKGDVWHQKDESIKDLVFGQKRILIPELM